jgi:CheY-like chemotaxis protein
MSRTILLADDSVTIQKVIELTFMDEDWEVVAVGNGDEALEQLDEMTPDFVIADVHMPGASGYDVCKQSKSLRPEVPVLLLVSTFEPFDEEEAERSGCDAFLKKPFDSQELQRLVEELSAEASGEVPSRSEAVAAEPGEAGEPAAESAAGEAEPFAIGFEEDDELPTRVPPPGEAAAGDRGWGEPGGTQAEPAVFEMELEDFEEAESIDLAPENEEDAEPMAASAEPETPAYRPEPEPLAPFHVEGPLSDEDVDRIARRVVELLGDRPVRDVAWEVVPDLAEVVIRDRLRELESQVEAAD